MLASLLWLVVVFRLAGLMQRQKLSGKLSDPSEAWTTCSAYRAYCCGQKANGPQHASPDARPATRRQKDGMTEYTSMGSVRIPTYASRIQVYQSCFSTRLRHGDYLVCPKVAR
jgi:hypothetical protein